MYKIIDCIHGLAKLIHSLKMTASARFTINKIYVCIKCRGRKYHIIINVNIIVALALL